MLLKLVSCVLSPHQKNGIRSAALALFKLRQTSHESLNKHLGLSNQENLYHLIFIKCNF